MGLSQTNSFSPSSSFQAQRDSHLLKIDAIVGKETTNMLLAAWPDFSRVNPGILFALAESGLFDMQAGAFIGEG